MVYTFKWMGVNIFVSDKLSDSVFIAGTLHFQSLSFWSIYNERLETNKKYHFLYLDLLIRT